MGKSFLNYLVLLSFLLVPLVGHAKGGIDFSDLIERLNLNRNTELAVTSYWRSIQDNDVKWTGVVTNVIGGRGRAEVYVANSEGQTYKGYNIVINTYDVDRAARLKKGESIRFSGRLRDYKGKKGHPIIIYLNEGQIQ